MSVLGMPKHRTEVPEEVVKCLNPWYMAVHQTVIIMFKILDTIKYTCTELSKRIHWALHQLHYRAEKNMKEFLIYRLVRLNSNI